MNSPNYDPNTGTTPGGWTNSIRYLTWGGAQNLPLFLYIRSIPCDPCLCLTQLNFSHVPHFRDASLIVVIAKLLIQFIHLLVEIFYPFFSEEILKYRVLMDDVDYYYPWVEYYR